MWTTAKKTLGRSSDAQMLANRAVPRDHSGAYWFCQAPPSASGCGPLFSGSCSTTGTSTKSPGTERIIAVNAESKVPFAHAWYCGGPPSFMF
jgi:hypothetical protein